MISEFAISMSWISADTGAEEARQTSGFLRIMVDEHVATRVDDLWSRSVRDEVFVSAYPLALWFAGSWFRLRWEPAPNGRPSVDWRMAHEMPAAGSGFVWPPLRFEYDGEAVKVICRRTPRLRTEPIHYLEHFRESLLANVFEQTVDEFVELVLERLALFGIKETELHSLWSEVKRERENPGEAHYRRIEAQLGFDPDEAPENAVGELISLASLAGEAASDEIAPACSGPNPKKIIDDVFRLAAAPGLEAEIPAPMQGTKLLSQNGYLAPWKRGRLLARKARAAWNIKTDRVDDRQLSDIFGGVELVRFTAADNRAPVGLAVRQSDSNRLKLLFRKPSRSARRFEAARFLAEALIAPAADRWLPSTDSHTARQKVQRTFAAEFLCPIKELTALLENDFSPEGYEKAGEYFGVSPLAIESQLANNGLIHRF